MVTGMMRMAGRLVLALGVATALAACSNGDGGTSSGGGSNNGNGDCPSTRCSRHGLCTERNYVPSCECETGYLGVTCGTCAQGYHREGFTECVANEVCGPDSCSGRGMCSVVEGVIRCACEAGYRGDRCDSCNPGYQSNTDGGPCVQAETCLATSCNGAGECDDSTGVIVCTCNSPGTGPLCADSCAGNNPCAVPGGTCENVPGGGARCSCAVGYQGATCAACRVGYHSDGAGSCVLDERCAPTTCLGGGLCSASTGTITCDCADGYQGDRCETCSATHRRLADGRCVPRAACATANTCGMDGTCDDSTGVVRCLCDPGYAGADCTACYPGYHRDNQGACVLDERCDATTCGPLGACEDVTGAVVCACPAGFSGTRCEINDDDCGTACGTGQCVDLVGARQCLCSDGTWGDVCLPGPVITSVEPARAPLLGGTVITITGSGFGAGATVRVGARDATQVNVMSDTVVTVRVPAGATVGSTSVQVTNPNAQRGSSPFSYTPAVFRSTGMVQTLTVPAGVTRVRVKAWGAGGGAGSAAAAGGGAGGFARGTLAVIAGDTLSVVVGGGGGQVTMPSAAGAGGGYSGVFAGAVSAANARLLAGGGGGGAATAGGNGGGAFGASGTPGAGGAEARGLGGGEQGGGLGGCSAGAQCGETGLALQGGAGGVDALASGRTGATFGGGGAVGLSPSVAAAGGGGGWFGGGGGANSMPAGAGGGSGHADLAVEDAVLERGGTPGAPPSAADADREAGVGAGGTAEVPTGGPGLVLLEW